MITLAIPITFFWMMVTTHGVVDTIFANETIRDGESIVSKTKLFELGFFSPGSSKNRYLGIWYKNITPHTVIWVANRNNPLHGTSGMFILNTKQVLLLLEGTVIWSSNFSTSTTDITPSAQLLDNGNFVVKGSTNEVFIWESFDYPGNAFVPGIKFGKNFITGRERYMSSWRTTDDPSPGEYALKWMMNEYPQVYKMKGSIIESRMGPWNGDNYAGLPSYTQNQVSAYKMEMITNQEEVYFLYTLNSTTVLERAILTTDGRVEFWHHDQFGRAKGWMQDWTIPLDNCDNYGMCGPYGSCNTLSSPYCGCLNGFKPAEEWRPDNWASGCQRRVGLDCKSEEGFLRFSGVKLPDTQGALFNDRMNLEECAVACKNNCSCTAYADPYIAESRSGCLRWFGDLVDIRVYPQRGQDLYVRMAASELLHVRSDSNDKKQALIKVFLSASTAVVLLGMTMAVYAWSKRKRLNADLEVLGSRTHLLDKDHNRSSDMGDIDLPLFRLSKIVTATNNFSTANKLGEGGFGPVYKGVLEGQEVAVKRLSKSSNQGLQEFKNEIICIAKLQHRNLVKLLGYCVQGEETMLIYEYLPNKSLDRFIFDDSKKPLLNWPQRFSIIHGIARGLLYLHQDSRLRIVHRDLKADNILLDADMNPKISDFGLARMFRGHETEANTHKVVGTLGYISPEYVRNGIFSVKSDIFSFGVLVLEIVSGRKNRGFSHEDHGDNLLGHAWRLHKESKTLDLIDEFLGESWSVSEVTRSIIIGLLCVQKRAEDRPSMSSVLFMLGGEGSLPPPKRPGFFTEGSGATSIPHPPISVNKLTITQIEAR